MVQCSNLNKVEYKFVNESGSNSFVMSSNLNKVEYKY